MDLRRKQFQQQLKQKLSQKCTANQNEEQFLIRSFKFFDYAGAGEVDFPTFQKAIAKMGVVVDESDLEEFFRVYDSNGNGRLDYKEFSDIVFGKADPSGSTVNGSQYGGSKTSARPTTAQYRGLRDPKPYLEAFRDKIKQRGARGIIGLQRLFKIMDDDNSKSLSKAEFRKAVRDFKVDIPEDFIDTIFAAFDLNRDGTIDYDEFLRIIRGDLTPQRLAFVKKAYQKLDKDGSGVVDIEDIRDVYNTSRHPDVLSGKKTSDQVLLDFLETFETHHNIMNGEGADGRITLDEFIEYYTNISASLDNDEYFALMMNNSWNLSGDSSAYKKYDKSWANQSPEKANAFAGTPHQGYQTGTTAVKMVVQRSGMVSSENPLSTTTRYYSNGFDAKLQTQSVANTKSDNRDYYLKTGVESKNNPLAHGTNKHYSSHHGKKVEEMPEKPQPKQPKYKAYMLQRITDKCVQRGERGLFGLKRLFQTFDTDNSGTLEFGEFKKAMLDFKLDIEEGDITNIFRSFDINGDGVLDLNEFMEMILGRLEGQRLQAVNQAYDKLDRNNRGQVPYTMVRETFDGKKHTDVCNGRKTEEEAISDFLEIFEIHHNTFNNFNKNVNVSRDEFIEFYRTLNPSYDDDLTFVSMVRGVWGVKNETPDVASRSYAGGIPDAQNSRDRYNKANSRAQPPFGVSQDANPSQWSSTIKSEHNRPQNGNNDYNKTAGAPTRQQMFVQQQAASTRGSQYGGASQVELIERFRERMAQRGARGILGLKRVFKIMDDDNSGFLDINEFNKAMRDYRVSVTPDEARKLFQAFDINGDGNISYDEFLRGVIGEMNQTRKNLVKRAFDKLDKNGNGIVELDDIRGVYNAKNHPDVKLGKKTEDEVLTEFLDTFEMHYALLHPGSRDKKITFDEFIEYYNNVSMSIDDDRYFELMMTNAWNLNNASYKKGWGAEY